MVVSETSSRFYHVLQGLGHQHFVNFFAVHTAHIQIVNLDEISILASELVVEPTA